MTAYLGDDTVPETVVLAIQDNGIGIAADDLPKVLDAFSSARLHRSIAPLLRQIAPLPSGIAQSIPRKPPFH